MAEVDTIINQITEDEALEKLGSINNSLSELGAVLDKNGASTDKSTMAINVVAGQVLALKNFMEKEAESTKKVKGQVAITNGSIDELTERFTARLRTITDIAEKSHQNTLEKTQNESKELIASVKSHLAALTEQVSNEIAASVRNAADLTSGRVQPVVLVSSASVKNKGRLKGQDLYDAKTVSGSGGEFTFNNYSDNQIAEVPNSSVVVFSNFNSFSLKAKGEGVSVTVNGNTYTLTDGETFGWGVTETARNPVTVTTDATSTAVAIYVDL